MAQPENTTTTPSGTLPRVLDLLLGRHLSMPSFSRSPADRAIRGLERRLEGALAKLLGVDRRMKGFGAAPTDDGTLHGALYLTAWRETLADGSVAEVGAYYRFRDSNSTHDGLEPDTVHWTLQISPGLTDSSSEPGYGWYETAWEAASALHLAAGRGAPDNAGVIAGEDQEDGR